MVRLLIDHGADVDAPDRKGLTPLMLAAGLCSEPAAKALLDSGAKVDALDSTGATPLHHAAGEHFGVDCANVVSLLLGSGANPSLQDEHGNSPLDIALHFGHEQSAEMIRSPVYAGRRVPGHQHWQHFSTGPADFTVGINDTPADSWWRARKADTVETYEQYIVNYPEAEKYVRLAKVRLERKAREGAALLKTCHDGHLAACTRLGVWYRDGTGMPKDLARAATLFKQACDGGDLPGCANLRAASP
jgi:hypothetical protein